MRRVFVIRKDLHLKPGKLAAMVSHYAEAYWTSLMKSSKVVDNEFDVLQAEDPWQPGKPAVYKEAARCKAAEKAFKKGEKTFAFKKLHGRPTVTVTVEVSKDIWNEYVNGIFKKTVCECRNKNQLDKAKSIAESLGLVEGVDFDYINDSCLTNLTPENEDGTCTVGMWFKPMPDDIAHAISKKFQLYRDEFSNDVQHNS